MKDISPEHLSYIIGFLQGDGHNYKQSRNRGKLSSEISMRDIDILNKIEVCLKGIYIGRYERIRDTNFKDNYKSCLLTIFDLETRRYFSQFIPVGKKSKFICPPEKESFFNKYAYIRGLTDADGSIGITSQNRPFWSLCTYSDPIKEFIVHNIKELLNFEKRINRNKRDNIYNIVLYDEDAVTYTKQLYTNATMSSDRKYYSFLDVQKWERSIPKCKGRKKSWLPYENEIIMNDKISIKDKMHLLGRSSSSIKTRLWRLNQ